MSGGARCDVCGGRRHELMFVLSDRLHGNGGSFPLVRCRDCGLVFISPRPGLEELSQYYPQEDYALYERAAGLKDSSAEGLEELFGPRRLMIEKYHSRGRLLDIGCGDGSWLGYMKGSGWNVTGVDFSEAAVAAASRSQGIDAFAGEVEGAAFADGSFDVITLWGVLEHTQSPRKTIAEAGRISGDGALLAVYTQNAAAPEARWLKQDWFIYEAPRHLYSFSLANMAELLAAGGFCVSEVIYETPLFYCQMNWQYFKERRLKRRNDVIHDPTVVDRMAVKLLSLYRRLASGRSWSSAMTVYAVKRETVDGGSNRLLRG
ncbi:MAG: class I SAM-dependent methyltransferase [Actinomycetota bacterium]